MRRLRVVTLGAACVSRAGRCDPCGCGFTNRASAGSAAHGGQHCGGAARRCGLHALRDGWLAREVLLLMARVLRRLDQTSKSLFKLSMHSPVSRAVCWKYYWQPTTSLRCWMMRHSRRCCRRRCLNGSPLPVLDGRTRLDVRASLAMQEQVGAVLPRAEGEPISAQEADEVGLTRWHRRRH